MPKFTWIPIYREIAESILTYENNQKGLIDLLTQVGNHGLPIISLTDRNKQNEEIPLSELDPFTFFATWNRGVRDQHRIDIIAKLQELLHLNINPPQDFSGIPIVNNQQAWFFAYEKNRTPEDIPLLWKLFLEALSNSIKPATFNSVLKIRCVKYNITMGLFWIDPYNFLNLDSVNRAYLQSKNINMDRLNDFDSYTSYMNETKKTLRKPFFEISYEAWLQSKNGSQKPQEGNANDSQVSTKYWLFAPGRNAEFWDEFYSAGIMAIGWDDLGDLNKYSNKESIAQSLRQQDNDPDTSKKNDATSCYSFAHEMAIGDIIFAKAGRSRIVGWGIISSDYYYDDTRPKYKHVRKTEWKARGNWEVSEDNRFALKTITGITRYGDFVSHLNRIVNRKTVISTDSNHAESLPNYWILQGNPKVYRVVDALRDGKVKAWSIRHHKKDTKQGDKFILWVVGEKAGCYALGTISGIFRGYDDEDDFKYSISGENIETDRCNLLFDVVLLDNPILKEEIENNPVLKDFKAGLQGTNFPATKEQFEELLRIAEERKGVVYTLEQANAELFIKREILEKAISLLQTKKNIILQGPPGAGKTFFAKRLAYVMLGKKDNTKVQMIQFHQSYSYEDFMQGYRPTPDGRFELKNGVFYTFCRQAQRDENNKYFFIIDEINRGNLSKIFGELMMLAECDKRGREFALPLTYAQSLDDKFYIPENLHIIGTMNTADRSLAMVDYALRRRFCFIDLLPAFGETKYLQCLADAGATDSFIKEINSKMDDLNTRIEKDKNLGKGFKIGHSYFCPQPGIKINHDWFHNIIYAEIEPLLKEYWFDNPDEAVKAVERLLS